jgi:hypothetical protein
VVAPQFVIPIPPGAQLGGEAGPASLEVPEDEPDDDPELLPLLEPELEAPDPDELEEAPEDDDPEPEDDDPVPEEDPVPDDDPDGEPPSDAESLVPPVRPPTLTRSENVYFSNETVRRYVRSVPPRLPRGRCWGDASAESPHVGFARGRPAMRAAKMLAGWRRRKGSP